MTQPWSEDFKKRLGAVLQSTFPDLTDDEAYRQFDEHMLSGEVLAAGDEIGCVTWKLSNEVGLRFGPRVFAAPFDTFAQLIGMGMRDRTDELGITFGTSQAICAIPRRRLQSRPRKDIDFVPIPDAPIPGLSLLFDGIASCGGAIRFVCENYGLMNQLGQVDYQRIEECLQDTGPGAEGITMLPYYNGGRRVSRRGQVEGKIEGLNQGKERANVVRALFESIAFITRGILNDFEHITGRQYRRVLVSGGPTKNRPFMMILASVLERDVVLFRQTDASLVGCAVCAATGLGWYPSLGDAAKNLVQREQAVAPDPALARAYRTLCNDYLQRFHADIPLIFERGV